MPIEVKRESEIRKLIQEVTSRPGYVESLARDLARPECRDVFVRWCRGELDNRIGDPK